jgi:glycosyltransferase involved in cell wall biosynthesis
MTAMRLNWFSPLPPERTDIAHYTARLAPALMGRFDVVFWTDLKADAHALPPGAEVQTFDPARIEGRDFNAKLFGGLNVYNFGNDARFHAGIADVALKIPGLAILHDTRLHHFVFERSRGQTPAFAAYLALARDLYGSAGEAAARRIVAADGRTIDEHVDAMPFAEAFADKALGVVCHSTAARAEVRRGSDTPVLTLPLPFTSLARPPRVERAWAAPWRLVMFGYVNPNRRLESVLRALSSWRGAPDFRLDIFGALWDRPRIERLIAQSGLKSRVTIHGFVSEQALDEAIAGAHLAFNLRHPTMGEASGGILRSWAHATPALVTNAGWYADLPDDVARKISLEAEIADIHRALSDLVDAPHGFEQMGLCARRRLQDTHAPQAYADALAAALSALPELTKRFASRRLLQRVAAHARSREERSSLLDRASEQIPALFSAKGSSARLSEERR